MYKKHIIYYCKFAVSLLFLKKGFFLQIYHMYNARYSQKTCVTRNIYDKHIYINHKITRNTVS